MGERIIRILISAIFLVLVFFVFQGIFKSCKSKKGETITKTEAATEALESSSSEKEEYAGEYFDDYVGDQDDEEYTSYGGASEDFNNDLFDEPEESTSSTQEAKPATPKPASKPKPKPAARNTASNSSGKYIAVAGNYLIIDNARNMVQKLQNLGYDGAEYFTFDGSEYYTVGAIRSNDYASVQSSARDLRQRGIDNYIHTVR